MPRIAKRLKRFGRHQRFIEKEVRRLLPQGSQSTERALNLLRPEKGKTTLTLFVDTDTGQRFVLRCLPKRAELDAICRAAEYCQAQNVRVPRVVARSVGWWPRLLCGFHLLLEEFVHGVPIEPLLAEPSKRHEVLQTLAEGLSRLHAVRRNACGSIVRPDGNVCLYYHFRKTRKTLAALRKRCPETSRPIWQATRDFLEKGARMAASHVSDFPLIHGDLGGGNVLIGASGELILIDLERMHFGFEDYDLQCVLQYLLKDDLSAYRSFLEAYTLSGGTAGRDRNPCLTALFRFIVLLRSLPLGNTEGEVETRRRRWEEIAALAQGDTGLPGLSR